MTGFSFDRFFTKAASARSLCCNSRPLMKTTSSIWLLWKIPKYQYHAVVRAGDPSNNVVSDKDNYLLLPDEKGSISSPRDNQLHKQLYTII